MLVHHHTNLARTVLYIASQLTNHYNNRTEITIELAQKLWSAFFSETCDLLATMRDEVIGLIFIVSCNNGYNLSEHGALCAVQK